jgi:hypothetical protein
LGVAEKIVAWCAFAYIKLASNNYERGEKQNESFKSNHDRGRFGQCLEPGCLRAKERGDDYRNHGSVDAYLIKIGLRLRTALT